MNALLTTALIASIAQQPAQPQHFAFESQLKTLVVFKEGFGFFLREGAALLEDGWATTNLVPRAAVGTFYVYPLNATDRVETIVTTPEHLVPFDKPEQLRALLANKVGLRLRIVTTQDGSASGILAKVLDDMILLRTDEGQYSAVEYARISKVVLTDFPVRIKFRTANQNARLGIGVAYIQAGVRWEPSYLLELSSATQGRLTLRGTLLGLPEELKDADLVFVVGAPSLMNVGVVDSLLSGLASGATTALADLDQARREQAAKAADAPSGGFGGGGFASAPGASSVSDESGEFQYYVKRGFSLRPGERAMTVIFEANVRVHPFFDWNADRNDMHYVLRLSNTTGSPLTSAPVFVLDDGKPVGQPVMDYTAQGDDTELRMTRAVGIKAEAREVEVERGESVIQGEVVQTPITLRGTMTVENFRDKPAEVRIRKTINGRILDMSHGGVVKNTIVNAGSPNPSNQVEWTATVPAGQKLVIEYRYVSIAVSGRVRSSGG
jgi:hypothetical protein